MAEAFAKKSIDAVHRRRFLATATAAAGGALLPATAWPATPSKAPTAALPQAFDLRNDNGKNYITSVKDQDQPNACNACTAFAVVATVEGTFNKKNQQMGSQGPDFDEMALFLAPVSGPGDVASGGCGTSHWWPKYALARCQSTGLQWQGSPTKPPQHIETFKSLLSEDPNQNPINNLKQTQDAIKTWLTSNGPVAAVMVQYEDLFAWGKAWADQHPGSANPNVYSPGKMASPGPHRPPLPIVGGHVVSIVGYNDTGQKYWICKNSWGPAWNGDGYVLIEQGSASGPGPVGIGSCYIDLIDVWGVTIS